MTNKHSTKSEAEKEQGEAERLVRPAPKNKPPRRDKERGRMDVTDADIGDDKEDKDLSLNYKTIGGALSLSVRVAREFANKEQWEIYKKKYPKARIKNHTFRAPEGGGSSEEEVTESSENATEEEAPGTDNSPKKKRKRKPRKKKKPDEEGSTAPASEDGAEQKPPEPLPDHKKRLQIRPEKEQPDAADLLLEEMIAKPMKALTPEERDLLVDIKAKEYRESGATYDALYDTAITDDYDSVEAEAAQRIMLEQKAPYPQGMDELPEDFDGRDLDPALVDTLTAHVKNWDIFDHDAAVQDVSEKLAQARYEKDERKTAYFEKIQSLYSEQRESLNTLPSFDENVTIAELLPDPESLKNLTKRAIRRQVNYDSPKLYQAAMYSSQNGTQQALDDVKALAEAEAEGSSAKAYYEELAQTLGEVAQKKEFSENTSYGLFLKKVAKAGIEGLDPTRVDFTNPKQIASFIDQMRKLTDAQLATLVKDDPSYRLALDLSSDANADNAVLDTVLKERLFEYITDDLKMKGFYEQLRLSPEEPGRTRAFDPIQVDAYIKRQQDQRVSQTPTTQIKRPTTFNDFMMSLLEDLMTNTKTASAFTTGFRKALRRSHVKAASYRGLPGSLPMGERPPAPQWRLPTGKTDLDSSDYAVILEAALGWAASSSLGYVAKYTEDPAMLYRVALDYAILTASDYKYAGCIDAPTYEALLGTLLRIQSLPIKAS